MYTVSARLASRLAMWDFRMPAVAGKAPAKTVKCQPYGSQSAVGERAFALPWLLRRSLQERNA